MNTHLRRAVLAFAPLSSPTYVPLGLASLVAFVRRQVPGCDLRVCDLNIEAWHAAARTDADQALVRYFQGRGEDFFDADLYAARLEQWRGVGGRLARLLSHEARGYVERGEASAELRALLDLLLGMLVAGDPELVGLSVVFPDQLVPALALARRLRELEPRRRPTLVLGGAMLSALRVDELLRACAPNVDAVALGEGETTAARIFAGEPLDRIPGLALARARPVRPAPVELGFLPPPDFGALELSRYLSPEPVLPFLLSRGCRWGRCRFCAHNASWGRYRRLAPDLLADQLADLAARLGARHVYSADQYIEVEDLLELARALEQRGVRLGGLHVLGRPLPTFTAEALERIAEAGVCWIGWGVESGSQRLLDIARKGIRVEVVRQAIRDAAQVGISNLMMLIHGLPGSTDADLESTFQLVDELYPHLDALTASRFVLFATSGFGRRPERHGLRVLGAEVLLRVEGHPVHSHRLIFEERRDDGTFGPPRGVDELRRWERRRAWLPELPLLSQMYAEHYLLHAARRIGRRTRPIRTRAA